MKVNGGLSKNWMFVLVMVTGLASVVYGQSTMALPLNLDMDTLISNTDNIGIEEIQKPSLTKESSALDIPYQQNNTNSILTPNELSDDSVPNMVEDGQDGQDGDGRDGLAQDGQDGQDGSSGQDGQDGQSTFIN